MTGQSIEFRSIMTKSVPPPHRRHREIVTSLWLPLTTSLGILASSHTFSASLIYNLASSTASSSSLLDRVCLIFKFPSWLLCASLCYSSASVAGEGSLVDLWPAGWCTDTVPLPGSVSLKWQTRHFWGCNVRRGHLWPPACKRLSLRQGARLDRDAHL